MHKDDNSGPTTASECHTLKFSFTFRLCPSCTGVDSMDKACRAGRSEASLQREKRESGTPMCSDTSLRESENPLEKTFKTTESVNLALPSSPLNHFPKCPVYTSFNTSRNGDFTRTACSNA